MSFSQKTKAITEFRKEIDTIIKVRKSYFNNRGRLIKEVRFGGYDIISKTFRNRIKNITYYKNRKKLETNCEYFISSDTCIALPFSKYNYNKKKKTEKRIFYDSDSLIISITETKELRQKKYVTIYAWDFDPVKEPNYKTAFVIKDTLFFDKKRRILESYSYRENSEKPVIIEKYNYRKDGYTLQKESYGKKSIIEIKYSKQQIWANKRNLEYDFSNGENYYYEFESY
ncbi:hypothetical protein EGM88_14675 [Aureibaculum marinum]|uniref:Uncharacterized protein n=1 Tax=Aureibaculum marinum TaxID=2487930 RepID=A0A3N4N8G6_9FLAO|nr:hypothetical protein [Aureibaculum marinum]RPD91645.1 hypothetical protein EGM88_14675 [Aureibaculum marinum]